MKRERVQEHAREDRVRGKEEKDFDALLNQYQS